MPELVRLMEHRGEEVEQCNMLLLLLLVKQMDRKPVGWEGKGGGREGPHSVAKGEEVVWPL